MFHDLFLTLWICVNFVGDVGRFLASFEKDHANYIDGENTNANNHEYEKKTIEENECGDRNTLCVNIDWGCICWLALFMVFSKYLTNNTIQHFA